jgi:pyrroloquinoline quinone biosynthesis protein B
MKRFAALPAEVRAKIRFIHFNHTNPALDPNSAAARAVRSAGFAVANELERTPL